MLTLVQSKPTKGGAYAKSDRLSAVENLNLIPGRRRHVEPLAEPQPPLHNSNETPVASAAEEIATLIQSRLPASSPVDSAKDRSGASPLAAPVRVFDPWTVYREHRP